MKRGFIIFVIICSFVSFTKANPSLSAFTVVSNWLQDGKIKVYNNGTTEFIASIAASRSSFSGVYEAVNMEVVFYMQIGTEHHVLKTITLLSSHFNGAFLQTYNENQLGNNLVKIAIPQAIERGEVKVKYRFKDSNGNWQPGSNYYTFNSSSYQTVNVGTPYLNESHLAKIHSMGFSTTGIVDFNSTHYLVEGDVLIKKSSLNVSNPVYAVNNDKEHNVNLVLDQSILSHNIWPSAILTAVEVWNSTPNSNIKLNVIYSDYQYSPSPITDVLIKGDGGVLATSLAAVAEFPNSDGKSGSSILINSDFKDPSTNLFITHSKATRKVIHAIGHTLGLKHNNSSNSIMNGSTGVIDLEVYPILHNYDVTLINTLYPISTNSLIIPNIGGVGTLYTNGQFTYVLSYISKESGVYYKWEITGVNGTNYTHEFVDDTDGILSEMSLANPGNYQLKCTISGGKYSTPVTVTKDIVVN